MEDILGNLDTIVEILEEEKNLFLNNRNLLAKESKKLESTMRPIYMRFNVLYKDFNDNVNDIITAKAALRDIERMHTQAKIREETFLMTHDSLNNRILDSYNRINDEIFPEFKDLVKQISIPSSLQEKKLEFDKERNIEIEKVDKQIEGISEIDQIKVYLKQLFPVLIERAIKYTTEVLL